MIAIPETAGPSLLAAVDRGDCESWELLTEIYSPVVYRWAKQAGRSDECAADLVQDVFLTVFRQFDVQRVRRFRTWLWRVFRSRMIDQQRRNRDQAIGAGGTAANIQIRECEDHLAESEPSESEQEQKELRIRAILALKDQFERNVWESFYRTTVCGHSPKEIADELGITVWAVYQARNRCRDRLAQLLEALHEPNSDPCDASFS
ncbi:MAG: sigma-70 family RNA polymerase sigma factor [Planctomycetota bacterium]